MNRPLAYITADFSTRDEEADAAAMYYCRALYEAGYSPICPFISQSYYLNSAVPQEYKDGRDMAQELLRRSRILVVCGKNRPKEVLADIALAKRLRIATTTLEGILNVDKERIGKR